MKKIFFSLVAIAALAACTKSEVAYDDTPQEIGFVAVANNITKAPVSGTTYPTNLNLYVNAYTKDVENSATTPNYIANGEFTHINTYGNINTSATGNDAATHVWGGGTSSDSRHPYYWPNEKTLHFSGYSKSGNIGATSNAATASYNPSTDELTITDYTPGTGFATIDGATVTTANDLMWFPSTKYTKEAGYDKNTKYVPVNMYHTCSWITFLVQGDAVTGNSTSTYTITELKINGVDNTANVVCTGNTLLQQNTIPDYVVWTNNTTQEETYTVTVHDNGVQLALTYSESSTQPKNLETGNTSNTGGNIVVIPQSLPFPTTTEGKTTYSGGPTITLKYKYESPASTATNRVYIEETFSNLPLTIDSTTSANNKWEPGKHYVYTITVKATEILIAPTPIDWTAGTTGNVTVE